MAARVLRPLPSDAFDFQAARHLLSRAGFGGTPQQVQALANLGLDEAVDHLVEFEQHPAEPVRPDDFDHDIMKPWTDEQREQLRRAREMQDEDTIDAFRQERQRRQRADRRQMAAIERWWWQRLLTTQRPLEEKLTLFWHGHFATGYRKIEDSYHLFMQNELFRRHAAGRFSDLVAAIIRDPAMLAYLDNHRSRRGAPNENFARELMELFTMGESSGYTERDVAEAARALTGYTFHDDSFVFRESWHDDGEKTILGRRGRWDGDDLVRIILEQRVVSEYLCRKLYRFFINDAPNGFDDTARAFIRRLARQLRENNYRLKPVLRTLFASEHFYDPANRGAIIKSPVQLIAETVRTCRAPLRSLDAIRSASDLMGQKLFTPPSVKGWDGGRTWINTSTLYVRQNAVAYLLTGRSPAGQDWEQDRKQNDTPWDGRHLLDADLLDTDDASTTAPVRRLLRFMLHVEPDASRAEALDAFVEQHGGRITAPVMTGLMSIIAAMPEYQLC